jgi:hypothetical protein
MNLQYLPPHNLFDLFNVLHVKFVNFRVELGFLQALFLFIRLQMSLSTAWINLRLLQELPLVGSFLLTCDSTSSILSDSTSSFRVESTIVTWALLRLNPRSSGGEPDLWKFRHWLFLDRAEFEMVSHLFVTTDRNLRLVKEVSDTFRDKAQIHRRLTSLNRGNVPSLELEQLLAFD